MNADKVAKASTAWLQSMEARLDRLMDVVTDEDLIEMICIQKDLARDPEVRCATRQRASAKVMDFKIDTLTLRMKQQLLEHGEDDRDAGVKVLVVEAKDLDMARSRAAAIYNESVKKLIK